MSIKTFLDLGAQPIANGFLQEEEFKDEFFFDLEVGVDEDTHLVTQANYVPADKMFNDSYAYRGSMSKTMREHFSYTASLIKEVLFKDPKILEIGSNDGVFIKNWDKDRTFAVEPCGNFAQETNDMGYKTYDMFWDMELSNKILEDDGAMDLVYAANCMCHIPDLDSVFKAVHNVLSKEGLFVFEDPSLAQMINLVSYDQIYDEHAHIFSVTALKNILERNGFEIINVDRLPVHGGSNRIWAKKRESTRPVEKSVELSLSMERVMGLDKFDTFERFRRRVNQSKTDLLTLLIRCADEDKKVVSYGATSKSTTIFNFCGIGPDLISCITDTTPEKIGKHSPGTHLPIANLEGLVASSADFAFLGAWNFSKEIMEKELGFLERGGRFITHVPLVRFL